MSAERTAAKQAPALPPPPALPARLVNLMPPLLGGIAAWFVVFVVLAVARWGAGAAPTEWLWISLAGWLLGLIGLAIMTWQRAAARRGSRSAQRI